MKVFHSPGIHTPSRSRGAALVIALVAVMTVAMLGASYLQVTSSLVRRQTHSADETRAFYAAEAGLAESFQAIRMGRSGEVGTQDAPALHGDGLVWVEATDLASGGIRLDSTGLVGRGRSALSLLVEPVELNLGFFADDDLVIENAIVADGWNSEESTYKEAKMDLPSVTINRAGYFHNDFRVNVVLTDGVFYDYALQDGEDFYYRDSVPYGDVVRSSDARAYFDSADRVGEENGEGSSSGSEPAPTYSSDPVLRSDRDPTVNYGYEGWLTFGHDGESLLDSGTTMYTRQAADPAGSLSDASGEESASEPSGAEDAGAMIGSNGDIRFEVPDELSAKIYGDLRPGPSRSVSGLDNIQHTGDITPRTAEVELPPVEVPDVTLESPVRHEGLLPLYVPQGTTGYQRLEVAGDSDVVIRGPAVVVLGELVLEPGSGLLLDTRDGDVSLYVTGKADFQADSIVTTTGEEPDNTTLQVSAAVVGADGPTVNLEGKSTFYGTIYAPETDVHVGKDFEVYGGIVARRLSVAKGAQLHSDSGSGSDSPIPTVLGWRTSEVPKAARGGGNPFRRMGVQRANSIPLATAHQLQDVELDLVYVDQAGATRSYSGLESGFDWLSVESIVSADRSATRDRDEPDGRGSSGAEEESESTEPEPTPSSPGAYVVEALATMTGNALRNALFSGPALTDADITAIVDADKLRSEDLGPVLRNQALSSPVLLGLLDDKGMLTSSELLMTLQSNYPLPPDVADELRAGVTTLDPDDLESILLGL